MMVALSMEQIEKLLLKGKLSLVMSLACNSFTRNILKNTLKKFKNKKDLVKNLLNEKYNMDNTP